MNTLRLLFLADCRSPIAQNWIRHFIEQGHTVHLVSSYPAAPMPGAASFHTVPAAFSEQVGEAGPAQARRETSWLKHLTTPRARTLVRQWLGPLTLPRAARALTLLSREIQPDLVHAMRIPYEGMVAAQASFTAPLLLSVWGNDFTLHASSTPLMKAHTRRALHRASALHTDCQRDLHLARQWGFDPHRPHIVLPGGGGVQPEIFHPPAEPRPPTPPIVINPRGFRAYIRNDTFFEAIPLVLARQPETRFLCPAMAGEPAALSWLHASNLGHAITLLPQVPRPEMAALFRRAHIAVSPTIHDGTPNTLLEAMACGCFPIAGDIPSLREWITPGENGLLIPLADPEALAHAILLALDDAPLRARAAAHNARLIAARAAYGPVMQQAEGFYRSVVALKNKGTGT